MIRLIAKTKMNSYRRRMSNKARKLLKVYHENRNDYNLRSKDRKFIKDLDYQLKLTGRLWISPKQLRHLNNIVYPVDYSELESDF